MFDTTLIRHYAGRQLHLADGIRQEQAEVPLSTAEQFLYGLGGWFATEKSSQKHIQQRARRIAGYAQTLRASPETLPEQFLAGMERLKQQPDSPDALAFVMACVGVGAQRCLGYFPHPVQFEGVHALLTGRLAQMRTGEGKTLVAALAATIAAASGAYVHVLSTNDYLATRDEEEMRPLFALFGLDSSSIHTETEQAQRQQAYRCSICYVSAKELVFDYLKDQLHEHDAGYLRVQYIRQLQYPHDGEPAAAMIPALHFCIVDEADSILIDEARTPLIISREAQDMIEPELLQWAIRGAGHLIEGEHFHIRPAQRDVELLPVALQHMPALPEGVRRVWQTAAWQRLIVQQALSALYLYRINEHYIVQDGAVCIVDESTGRPMPDRSWQQGLHQLIETKEGVALSKGRETLAQMTFQRFFRQYFLLAGLTGTATEVARELWEIYRLRVRDIPSHQPDQRRFLPLCCAVNQQQKWQLVAADALRYARQGCPVLIGTRSVEASERAAAELNICAQSQSVDFVVLNARQDSREAEIVAQAGCGGRITVATNMAGRGTDIKLDATARHAGGLHVILSEYHEAARIDRQLAGRCGRQGDPGTVQVIAAFDDELLVAYRPWMCTMGRRIRSHFLAALWMRLTGKLMQFAAQSQSYRMRIQTLKQDRELSKRIGFAGKRR